jgi:hypothetical protein
MAVLHGFLFTTPTRFPNQVFGFFAILREPVSEIVKLIEERDGQFFERVELEIRS